MNINNIICAVVFAVFAVVGVSEAARYQAREAKVAGVCNSMKVFAGKNHAAAGSLCEGYF